MRRKISKETRERMWAAEREKDMVYYLDFIPLSGIPYQHSTRLDDLWCVELFSNPEGKPEMIDEAIKTFETKHNVKSWTEIAVRYKVNGFHFP